MPLDLKAYFKVYPRFNAGHEETILKTIFITGTGSGFGKATVELFASKGWNVAATVRKAEQLDLFKNLPNVKVYQLDVTDFARVEAVAQNVMNDFGSVDAVVNNAGFAQYGPLESSSMEQIKAQFETNYFGQVAVSKAFIPHFRNKRSGVIVNIASLSAKMGFPIFSVYSSSKAAVATLSEGLAVELAPFNVRVKSIFPGTHATRIFTKMDAGLDDGYRAYLPYIKNFIAAQAGVSSVSSPRNIAQLVWRAVNAGRDDYEYIGGRDASFLIALKRWLPQRAWKRIQVGNLLRAPSQAQLRFLSWVMGGTEPLETKADPRLS
jgi:NAD(P)-dependent dehydrogenase (short-subunit alcohol dehydrogenase family)